MNLISFKDPNNPTDEEIEALVGPKLRAWEGTGPMKDGLYYPYADEEYRRKQNQKGTGGQQVYKWEPKATIGRGYVINTPEEFEQIKGGVNEEWVEGQLLKSSRNAYFEARDAFNKRVKLFRKKDPSVERMDFDSLPIQARSTLTQMAYQQGGQGIYAYKEMMRALSAGNFDRASQEVTQNTDSEGEKSPTDYYLQTPRRAMNHAMSLYALSNAGKEIMDDFAGGDDTDDDLAIEAQVTPPVQVSAPVPTQDPAPEIIEEIAPVDEKTPDVDTSGYNELFSPNGFKILYPPEFSEEEALVWAKENYPEEFEVRKLDPTHYADPVTQYISTVYGGAMRLPVAAKMMWANATDDQELWESSAKEALDISEEQSRMLGLDPVSKASIGEAWEKDGVAGATAEFLIGGAEGIGQALGHMTIPAIVGAIGGGAVGFFSPAPGGTLAGSAAGASTMVALSRWLGFSSAMMSGYMASNMERAYYEGGKTNVKDLNLGKQFALATGQTALDALTMRLATGFKFLGATEKTAALASIGSVLERIDRSTGWKKIIGVMVEEQVAELGQTAMERYAAGLPVSPAQEEAFEEYAEIAVMTMMPSLGFGVGGHYSGKLNQRNSLRMEKGIRSKALELVEAMRAVEVLSNDHAGRKVEEEAEEKRRLREDVRNRQAELELELQRAKARFDEERMASLETDLEKIRSTYTGEVKDIDTVTLDDIHSLARSRNIAWDDDAAFIAFTMRMTGKPKLDMLSERDRRVIYQTLSDMPHQDVETSLQIATDQSVVNLARRLLVGTGTVRLERSAVIDALFGKGASKELPVEVQDKINFAYLVRGADLGLWTIKRGENGKILSSKDDTSFPIEKLFTVTKDGLVLPPDTSREGVKKGTKGSRLSEDSYQKIIDHVRKTFGSTSARPPGFPTLFPVPGEHGAGDVLHGLDREQEALQSEEDWVYDPSKPGGGRVDKEGFVSGLRNYAKRWAYRVPVDIYAVDRDVLKKFGISTPNEIQRFIAYALVRGDIVRRDNRYILAEHSDAPSFSVVVDGVEQGEIFSTVDEARKVVEAAYNPFEGKPAKSAYIIEKDPDSFDPDPVSSKEYEASKVAKVHHVIRDSEGKIVRVEANRKDALRWLKFRKDQGSSWDITLDGEQIGRHASLKDANEAIKRIVLNKKKGEKNRILRELTDRDREIDPDFNTRAKREAREKIAERRANAAANNWKRDHGLKAKKFDTGVPDYTLESEKGFIVRETKLRGGEGDVRRSAAKPVAFYSYEDGRGKARAEDKAKRLGGKREWREAVGGKSTRSKKQSQERRESLERPPKPETVQDMEEDFPILGPELSIPDMVEGAIPTPQETPAPDAPAPEFTAEQESLVKQLKKSINQILQKRKLDKVFRVNLVNALDDGTFANFDWATNTISIALSPEVLAGDLESAIKTIAPLLNAESIHGLRRLGSFSRREWSVMTKYVSNRVIPESRRGHYNTVLARDGKGALPEGATYLDMAKLMYKEQGDKNNWIDDDYVEEAVSAAFGDWSVDRKVASGMPEGLFKRTVKSLLALRKGLTEANFENADQIFNDLYGKDFGVRVQLGRVKDDWWLRRPDERKRLGDLLEQADVDRASLRREVKGLSEESQTILDQDPEGLRAAAEESRMERSVDEEKDVDSPDVVDPDGSPRIPRGPTHSDLSLINRIVNRFGFKGKLASDAQHLVGRHEARGSTQDPNIWGKIKFGAGGKPTKVARARVVVPKGHYEGGNRGYGEAALLAGEDAIRNETDFAGSDGQAWRALLDGFFRHLKAVDTMGADPKSITVVEESGDAGRVSYIWSDPSRFANPITVVLEENPETGDYMVVAARPSYKFIQPPGSSRASKLFPEKYGPDVSAEAVVASQGPVDRKVWSDSDRERFSLTDPATDVSPEENAVLEGIGIPSENDGTTLWKKLRQNIYDWGYDRDSKVGLSWNEETFPRLGQDDRSWGYFRRAVGGRLGPCCCT